MSTDTNDGLGAFLQNDFGEPYLYGVNRHAFLRTGAGAVFAARHGEALFAEDTCYVVCGSDSGLLIAHVLTRGVPRNSRYLFVETPAVLARLREVLPERLPEGVELRGPDEWLARAEALGINHYANTDRLRLERSLGAEDLHHAPYLELWRSLKAEIDFRVWEARSQLCLAYHWSKQLENLPDNQFGAQCLENLFPGATAVVLAGGPSLTRCFPWLRAHRDDVVVVAASRIARVLIDAGIEPDLIVSIDPYVGNFTVSKEILAFQEHSVLVNGFHLVPSLLSTWTGRKVYIGARYPWGCDNQPATLPQHGPTVTNACIGVTMAMGCARVVLAGVDLCYSPEGFTHAEGTLESEAGPALMEGDRLVETYGGQWAETKNEFYQAAGVIERLAEQARAKGCRLINPSADAMRLEHVDHVPLDEVPVSSLSRPALETLHGVVPAPPDSAARIAHCRDVRGEVQAMAREVRAVRALAGDALRLGRRMFDTQGQLVDFTLKSKIDRLEKRIAERHGNAARLIKSFGLGAFLAGSRITAADDWNEQEIREYIESYYSAYRDTADQLLALFEHVDTLIRARLEEEKPQPDFEWLFALWSEERHAVNPDDFTRAGRALAWRRLHPARYAALDTELKARFDELERRFHAFGEDADRIHRDFTRETSRLHGLAGRAGAYFRDDRRDALERLARGLRRHAAHEDAASLGRLVAGYLHELDGDTDAAIAAYTATDGAGREDALNRAAVLHLGRGEHQAAAARLAALAEASPFYLPYHADLLRITGDVQGALDAYTRYCQDHPEDLVSMMKMGRLCHELGLVEATAWVMRHVLERDPDNAAAQRIAEELVARHESA